MKEPIIKVERLKKSYKKRRQQEYVHAVNDISFNVYRGEILGLLGPNGAGKTSTIKMICGLLRQDSGTIMINSVSVTKKRLKALNHISAVLEGNRNLYWRLTVRENLEYFAGNRGQSRQDAYEKIEELLKEFNLKDKETELVNRLSRGMQQKLAIAVALLAESDVILLDEPTLGIDVETGYEVREILKKIVEKNNCTIIISSHDMDVIQHVCERTIIINEGRIVTDDRVDNLMRLFSVRSYTITLGAPLTTQQHELLQEEFSHFKYDSEIIQPTLEIDLEKSKDIYQLFEILKKDNTPVETIDRRTINFEQIFVRILKGENGYALAPTS